MIRIVMFRMFSDAPERPANALPMRQYCEDLETAVAEVRKAIPNADNDPGFKQAATTITKLVENGKDMEDVYAWDLPAKNATRKALLKELGDDRAVNVTGEASKLLAEKYRDLMIGIRDKKYWPLKSATTYESSYASSFEKSKPAMQRVINLHDERIKAYESRQNVRKAI